CTPAQAAAHIHDTNGMFFADTLTSGHGFCNPSLVRMLATKSHEVVPFMASHGVHLDAVSLCGGHSVPRTHHEPPRADGKPSPIGWNMVSALKRQVEAKADAITILTKARVVKLLQEAAEEGEPSGAAPVRGVQYLVVGDGGKPVTGEPVELLADAVILTTGGFGNDHSDTSLLAEYAPHLACLPTTNGAFAEGDGVKIAREAGAYLRGMRSVQVHPTGFVDPADPDNRTKFLGTLRATAGCPSACTHAHTRRPATCTSCVARAPCSCGGVAWTRRHPAQSSRQAFRE
ncbi:FAD-binding protein, partial [archaeon]